jgi:two-component system CheB/CheR fusion protein
VDITERQRAEEARRQSEERFRALVESARDYAIFTTDPSGYIQEWLPGAAAIFGWMPDEAVGQYADILYTPEDRAQRVFEEELTTAREQGYAPNVRWHERKDGSRVFIEGSSRALHDASGRTRAILKIGQDVTERRRNEESLRESEAHAKLLLAELQHRVRNTLGVVRSIASRTAVTSRTVEEYASNLAGRISAFARVQAAVTQDPTAGLDLEQIVGSELLAHASRDGEPTTSIQGPKVLLAAKAAETLALAIHELAVNAAKHGALADPRGRVRVSWRIEKGLDGAEPRLAFEWTESGVALSGEPPTRQGFGTELLERTLVYELGATTSLRFEASGFQFSLDLPLTNRVVTEPGYTNLEADVAR